MHAGSVAIASLILAIWIAPKFSNSNQFGFLTEEEQVTISSGLRNISKSLERRSCIFEAERIGLNRINSVLVNHQSDSRVVRWFLPERTCNE